MRLATISTGHGTSAARISGGRVITLPYRDVVELLTEPDWPAIAAGVGEEFGDEAGLRHDQPVVRPAKTFCVGLNYRSHAEESAVAVPRYPTLFAKFPDTLTGASSPVCLPSVSDAVDWEVELGIVIGRAARRVPPDSAMAYVAGLTVVNDVSMRDWQGRTSEWLAGKNFEASTPVGPTLVTLDEFSDPLDLRIGCEVDGRLMQDARTSDLLFSVAELVSYVSTFTTLRPGDLIASGTPAGVAAARADKPFLRPGQVVDAFIEGIGSCRNEFYAEALEPVGAK